MVEKLTVPQIFDGNSSSENVSLPSDAMRQHATSFQQEFKELKTAIDMSTKIQEGHTLEHAQQYDAVIIGAGMAGLAAGRVLQRSSKKIVILEADMRVGGRALTDDETFDVPFDCGATWIHEAPINPLMKQAKEIGTKTVACEHLVEGHNAGIDAVAAGSLIEDSWDFINNIMKKADKRGVDATADSLFQAKTIFDQAALMTMS